MAQPASKKPAKMKGSNWGIMAAFGQSKDYKKAAEKNQKETPTGKNNRLGWPKKGHGKGSIGKAASIKATLKERAEKHAID